MRYVAADLTALQAAALSGLNRNTVNRLYRGVRERMLLACEAQRRLFGVVEVDESFFGARRVKGRRGARRLRQDRRLRHLRAYPHGGERSGRPGSLLTLAPGRRRRSPASGSHRTERADFPHSALRKLIHSTASACSSRCGRRKRGRCNGCLAFIW